MKLLKFPKSLIIGKNNYIEPGVKLCENVIIGDNNKIYDGTVIYPNTKIGNNNVVLNNNILGEHPVEAKEKFKEKVFGGLEIGNDNFLHVNNLIFNGYYRKTRIGNNNKILADAHISHDTHIHNNVHLYPRVVTAGLTTLMDFSTMGMCSSIQQKSVLGSYAMIGMGNHVTHNVFPFFIYFNRKYARFNMVKIPENLKLNEYELEIRNLLDDLKTNNCDKDIVNNYKLPDDILQPINNFMNFITINKI
jgi:acyl-[acyl carrier protein]--UDP-N-acetylglucosamine O-acyltransferase